MFTMGTTTGVQNIAKDMVIAVNLRYSFNRCSSGISFFVVSIKGTLSRLEGHYLKLFNLSTQPQKAT